MKRCRTMRVNRNLYCVCVITLLTFVPQIGYGLAQEPPRSVLEITLEIGKSSVVLGEPVYATARLVNRGSTPVDVSKYLDPQTGALQIEVSSSNRPRFVFLPLFYADALRTRAALAPGEDIATAVPIFYGALGWTFDRPGAYMVTAEYRPQGGAQIQRIRSTAVGVVVVDWNGIGASLVATGSASEEAARFLLWQRGDQLQAGQAFLTDLLNTSPDSPLADCILLAFGRSLSRSFRNYATGKIRQAECEPALEYFQKVRSDRLPTLLQIQQHLDEARCYIKVSHPAQAQESMKRAEQLDAGHPEFRLLFQQAVRLERHWLIVQISGNLLRNLPREYRRLPGERVASSFRIHIAPHVPAGRFGIRLQHLLNQSCHPGQRTGQEVAASAGQRRRGESD